MKCGSGLLIEMDGNLWAGSHLIKGDPREQNSNGKYLEEFLSLNLHLTLVNGSNKCEGKITRERTTIKGKESSILDFFIVCDKVMPFVHKMKIDEEKDYALTRYDNKKKEVKDSDHNLLIMEVKLNVEKDTSSKEEFYNIRNQENIKTFKISLDNSNELTSIVKRKGNNVKVTGNKWFHILKRKISQNFKKI